RDEAIYMVMTDRFRNGDPSNDLDSVPGKADWWQGGDLQGVIDELDYIKGLGMTAIWITPVAEQMGEGYHGYWTRDPYKIDPHLGDRATLEAPGRTDHTKGLKVVLDVVINHLGYGHPWLTDDEHIRWFHYLCPINFADQKSVEDCWLAGLPDLNTENPSVRRYLKTWALWLVDQTGVDGFRVDAARHLPKEFLLDWTGIIKAQHPVFWILGEVYSSGYRYQSGFLDAGLDAVTDFQTYDSVRIGLDPRGNLGQLTTSPSLAADLGTGREDARAIFIDNHDVPRFVGRDVPDAATKARLEQAIVYLFTMPGTPVLYYGTEVALPGGPDPDDRRPMPWTGGDEDVRQLVRDVATLRQATRSLRQGSFDEVQSERGLVVYDRRVGPELDPGRIDGLAITCVVGRECDPLGAASERDDLRGLGEVQRDQDLFALGLARVREDPAGRGNGAVGAAAQRRRRLAEPIQPAIQREERRRIVALRGDVIPSEVAHREPRIAGREARIGRHAPLHRRALGVAAVDVDDPPGRDRHIGHPH